MIGIKIKKLMEKPSPNVCTTTVLPFYGGGGGGERFLKGFFKITFCAYSIQAFNTKLQKC